MALKKPTPKPLLVRPDTFVAFINFACEGFSVTTSWLIYYEMLHYNVMACPLHFLNKTSFLY
jgi:hypothetical protein